MALEYEELTEKIIGAAIEVHRRLGPGFIESFYEQALVIELQKRGLVVERQKPVTVYYDGVELGTHRLDLIVEGVLVLELKAVKAFEEVHFAVTRSYLTATGLRHGLLLNFARSTLEVKRVIRP